MRVVPAEGETEDELDTVETPFFEDATSKDHGVRGHTTSKTVQKLKGEVEDAIKKLGGNPKRIREVKYVPDEDDDFEERKGFLIQFTLHGNKGRIPVAALPIKNKKTDRKEKQALKQALYTIRDNLETQLNMKYLTIDSEPLMQFLVLETPEGDRTLGKVYHESGNNLALGDGR